MDALDLVHRIRKVKRRRAGAKNQNPGTWDVLLLFQDYQRYGLNRRRIAPNGPASTQPVYDHLE